MPTSPTSHGHWGCRCRCSSLWHHWDLPLSSTGSSCRLWPSSSCSRRSCLLCCEHIRRHLNLLPLHLRPWNWVLVVFLEVEQRGIQRSMHLPTEKTTGVHRRKQWERETEKLWPEIASKRWTEISASIQPKHTVKTLPRGYTNEPSLKKMKRPHEIQTGQHKVQRRHCNSPGTSKYH